VLQAVDVPATPVLTLADALATEQADINGTIFELPETQPRLFTAGLPIRSPDWPQAPRRRPPGMGEDTAAVLGGLLGLTKTEIDRLVATEVVGLH
jgi:crotonobetainyl-CoA:carnitine CoA-transferase CaiB-like acyl-CoA transferase